MQGYNVILVLSNNFERLLMCRRRKNPYKDLNNLVGGKIEKGEDGFAAAYRELFEETNISSNDIQLHHVMDFTYYLQDCYVEVYAGELNNNVDIKGNENELFWTDLNNNFFDMKTYVGEGNIGHMIEQIKIFKSRISN